MFRKLTLGFIAAAGLMAPVAVPASVDANEYHHHHHGAYRVYYRDPCRPGWVLAGSCARHREALLIAEPFRCRGFAIWIR